MGEKISPTRPFSALTASTLMKYSAQSSFQHKEHQVNARMWQPMLCGMGKWFGMRFWHRRLLFQGNKCCFIVIICLPNRYREPFPQDFLPKSFYWFFESNQPHFKVIPIMFLLWWTIQLNAMSEVTTTLTKKESHRLTDWDVHFDESFWNRKHRHCGSW